MNASPAHGMPSEDALSDLIRAFMLRKANGKLTQQSDGSLDDEDSNWGFDPADLSRAIRSLIRPAFEAERAAGRLAGLREAAEVARAFSNVQPGDASKVQAAEWQYGIASAILALAEGKEG